MTLATTYPELVRAYIRARGVPPVPEEYAGVGTLRQWLGVAIVVAVGVLAVSPVVAVAVVVDAPGASAILFGALGVVSALFLGGPAADRVLGIPREVGGGSATAPFPEVSE